MTAQINPDGALVVRYARARAMLDVGNTKLHQLLNGGYLDAVTIGERGKRITVASIERLISQGVPRSRKERS